MDIRTPETLTDAEILGYTQGEVKKLVELILAIPEWEGAEPSAEFLLASSETIRNRFMEVHDFVVSLLKSMEQHEATPFLEDLKKGYESGELDALHSSLENLNVDSGNLSEMRKRKLLMIELSTFPDGKGLSSFATLLRQNIAQWFSISDSARHMDKVPQVRNDLPQSADHAASSGPKSSSSCSKFRKESARALLAPIAALMTDYPVYWDDLTIEFDIWGGLKVEGKSDYKNIVVYPCTCICHVVLKPEKPPRKMSMIGKRIMRVLAHEFRHTQQQRLWDTDIPKVEWEARGMKNDNGMQDKTPIDVYHSDPGEIDARKFSELVENSFDEKFLRKIGRLALRYHKRHCKEYCQRITEYFDAMKMTRT